MKINQSKVLQLRCKKITSNPFVILTSLILSVFSLSTLAVTVTPRANWADSYSANGKCYCASTFDHGIGDYKVQTPAGLKNVREICNAIGSGPGKGNNPVYNTVQCGHEPAHDEATIIVNGRRVMDEKICPGRVDLGSAGCNQIGPKWDLSVFGSSSTPPSSSPSTAKIVHMSKRNATDFAMDGDNGGADNRSVYLWTANTGNANQQWEEINRGSGYYTYKKRNTDFCLDGGNGGAKNQNVILYTCDTNNQNQHWKKVDSGGGNYRLEKRNAAGFSIDGNNGGATGQNVKLWTSSSTNQNQQWKFTTINN